MMSTQFFKLALNRMPDTVLIVGISMMGLCVKLSAFDPVLIGDVGDVVAFI